MTLSRWSAPRAIAVLLIAVVWIATGVGVYLFLALHHTSLSTRAPRPGQDSSDSVPLQRLPGSIYIVQDGTLYRLHQGTFTPLLNPTATGRWTMPAVSPDGQQLVAVRREHSYSDLYLVDAAGHVQSQLTHDASQTLELNHWALYPRFAPDGSRLWFSYDSKDRYDNYNVVLAVWTMPLNGGTSEMHRWTTPNSYTGGDVQPVPLPAGGAIYTRYGLDTNLNRIMGQIWLTTGADSEGYALTPAEDDCSQPALSPDGRRLAMICTGGKQTASIEVAAFDGANIGRRQVLVSGQLAAQPTWSPSGGSLVYLAAQSLSGHFQLWLQQVPDLMPAPTPVPSPVRLVAPPGGARVASPTAAPIQVASAATPTAAPPPAPAQLTTRLDFDATSAIAWHA